MRAAGAPLRDELHGVRARLVAVAAARQPPDESGERRTVAAAASRLTPGPVPRLRLTPGPKPANRGEVCGAGGQASYVAGTRGVAVGAMAGFLR